MKNLIKITFLTLLVSSFYGCKDDIKPLRPGKEETVVVGPEYGTFAKGADISWITEQESQNIKFYTRAGVQSDIYQILKNEGMNTIRLRVWVNPAGGWCNQADMLTKALRAKAAGMRVLLDFHYSDVFADPGRQTKPAAWANQDIAALRTSVFNHTVQVMTLLKDNGITPEWAQVGNETNDGMLWPEGRASTNMANFASLIQSGYNAVKSVSTTTKVMVHISNGFNNSLFRYIFDGLRTNNVNYDIIGMSLYPTVSNWQTYNNQCLTNMNDMVTRYNKEVMVVEVGMPSNVPNDCKSFIADLITKTKSVTSNKGMGVLYWEPQSYNGWKGYGLGAFDVTGRPTIAIEAFNN